MCVQRHRLLNASKTLNRVNRCFNKIQHFLQTFNSVKYLSWLVALCPTNSTLFLNICVTLLKTVAIFFRFAIMAFYSFSITFGKNSGCDATKERFIHETWQSFLSVIMFILPYSMNYLMKFLNIKYQLFKFTNELRICIYIDQIVNKNISAFIILSNGFLIL